MKRGLAVGVAGAWIVLVFVGNAGAHGGLEGSSPEDGARLKQPPKRVEMAFSEVPSEDSVIKVVDGCKRNVVASSSAVGSDLVAEIGDAQPGKWSASYRVISAEDGHLTKGSLHFTVAGRKDCNPDDDEKNGSAGDPTDDPGGGSATPPDDEGSDFPVVPVVLGTAGLVVVGFVVRRASAG